MYPKPIIISIALSALFLGSCNTTGKLVSESNAFSETNCNSAPVIPNINIPKEYEPSGFDNSITSSPISNEIVYYSSVDQQTLLTENDLIISPIVEIGPDTLPEEEWLSQSQLARESKIAGIWGLALFIIVPYLSIVFGIIALSKGLRAKKTIARAPEKYINANDAVAGIVMGTIIVGLFVLGLIALAIFLMAASGILNLPDW